MTKETREKAIELRKQGHTYTEISLLLGISRNDVMSLISPKGVLKSEDVRELRSSIDDSFEPLNIHKKSRETNISVNLINKRIIDKEDYVDSVKGETILDENKMRLAMSIYESCTDIPATVIAKGLGIPYTAFIYRLRVSGKIRRTYKRLTYEDRLEIVRLRKTGLSIPKLAKMFDVSNNTIMYACKNPIPKKAPKQKQSSPSLTKSQKVEIRDKKIADLYDHQGYTYFELRCLFNISNIVISRALDKYSTTYIKKTRTPIDEIERKEILRLYDSGLSAYKIANILGRSVTSIYKVIDEN